MSGRKDSKSGSKGFKTEELIKSYFLESGFFVLRGVSLEYSGLELTDIDIWTYERSASLARHRTIFDIKDKQRPQAAERLLFVKGVSSLIDVEGAGVVTTDKQHVLREIAEKQGLIWIGGDDLNRLKSSATLTKIDRLTEEQLLTEVKALDSKRRGKPIYSSLRHMRAAVATRLGISSANAALEGFENFAVEGVRTHPGSEPARSLLRLTYHAAAIAAVSFDFSSQAHILRHPKDRAKAVAIGLRVGADPKAYDEQLKFAEAAIRAYAPDELSLANTVRAGIDQSVQDIPAEPLAEIIVEATKTEKMFEVAKELNAAAYASELVGFDNLSVGARGILGAFLDFSGVDRIRYSKCLGSQEPTLFDTPR